jgi:hypothetical protein
MRPFTLAPGLDKAGFAKIGKVTGNFGLVGFEDALEMADANFAITE